MAERNYDAILLDLDGTLVADDGHVPGRTQLSLKAAQERGAVVMIATGRSHHATAHVLAELELETPAIVFNGAAVYCPRESRLLETQLLSNVTLKSTLDWCLAQGHLPVLSGEHGRFSIHPRNEEEQRALDFYSDVQCVSPAELPLEYVIRATIFSAEHSHSEPLGTELQAIQKRPVYITHFPLNALAKHRSSKLIVADVQPPCRGKGEGLRILRDSYGIEPARVVAVGDANNDLPMFRAAGLAVAMGNASPDAKREAQRVIGDNNSEALADLIDELF